MKGDFSKLHFDPHEHDRAVSPASHGLLRNISGVMHQQGRVMSDADLTEGELIELGWEGQAGRDIIGAGVCAVPSSEPDGFRIESAFVSGSEVHVTVRPGHAWADGILTRLAGVPPDPAAAVERLASYFGPPIADPQPSPTTIDDGVRDAVILEVSEEALHGFQYPERLIEPALGGPDTAERAFVNFRFRLLRLGEGEDCHNILDRLRDDPGAKGRLSVALAPVVALDKDCPVVGGGGYTGFEHHLYRIEIADTPPAAPGRFKWSQWNGGLVGRGRFDATVTPARVTIDAGRAAIVNSGLAEFYLEALRYDELAGTWNVVYATTATLNSEHDLELAAPPSLGTLPATTDSVFFRLWNGIADIASFTNAVNPVELRDGIRLVFDPPAAGNYRPGDYWTFTVRAGEIGNPPVLIDNAPPTGIVYHRVPLAEIHWTARLNTTISGSIEECRHPFHPLTRLATCCTRRVGDGIQSHGEFISIQAAIDSLPAAGGQICVLPGTYTENVRITNRRDVILSGCGKRSRLVSNPPQAEFAQADPVIHIVNSTGIRIESLAVEAHDTGYGILVETQAGGDLDQRPLPVLDIVLTKLSVQAALRSAIEVRGARFVTIEHCDIDMRDVAGGWPGLFVTADDALIERNTIRVLPSRRLTDSPAFVAIGGVGLGGMQIGGTSERVRIIDNLIQGGRGNGITLGSVIIVNADEQDTGIFIAWPIFPDDPCQPCRPGDSRFPDPVDGDGGEGGTRTRSAGALYDIHVERNRILDMGMNGIGVAAFFNLDRMDEFISVDRLSIVANLIRGCLRRPLAAIDAAMIDSLGYGGIQLADVSYLLIRDNLIEDNGPSHLEPVCGVFVLHGEGIDVSANRILNNGAKIAEPATQAKGGRRSGIHVVYCIAPRIATDFGRFSFPVQNGVPALKVHDNIVSQPLGQALAAAALGPVSVQGNQLTSRGVVLRSEPALPTFPGATVLIFNLGLSNEAYWQLLAFSAVKNGQITSKIAPSVSNDEVVIAQPGLDDVRIGQYLANGNVLFCDNQCVLDLLERGTGFALASVTILSLDDVGFHDNQCDCNLFDDFVISQAFLFGISLRVSDNRFKEGIFNALYSAVTLGVLNTTTDNQATHCLLIRGWPGLMVDQPNTVTLAGVNPRFCGRYGQLITSFGQKGVITNG
ncbi:MAG: DUF6519 domain-containing protein [Gammaproteobacteria bacterium]